jgi:hypothetical protein
MRQPSMPHVRRRAGIGVRVPVPRFTLLISTLAVVGALGCGGREGRTSASSGTRSSSGSTSGDSGGASGGLDASTPVDASDVITERNPQCPAAVPTAGNPCKPILECEYGADLHHVCTTVATCGSTGSTNFTWFLSPPTAGCGTNAASCPASFAALAAGSPCPGVSSFCEYPEGLCRCVPCSDEAGLSSMWGCGTWAPGGAGCPSERPLSGDACDVSNQECSYGGYCGVEIGPNMVCQDGYWRATGLAGSCSIPQCSVPETQAVDGGTGDGEADAEGGLDCGWIDDAGEHSGPCPQGGTCCHGGAVGRFYCYTGTGSCPGVP